MNSNKRMALLWTEHAKGRKILYLDNTEIWFECLPDHDFDRDTEYRLIPNKLFDITEHTFLDKTIMDVLPFDDGSFVLLSEAVTISLYREDIIASARHLYSKSNNKEAFINEIRG